MVDLDRFGHDPAYRLVWYARALIVVIGLNVALVLYYVLI